MNESSTSSCGNSGVDRNALRLLSKSSEALANAERVLSKARAICKPYGLKVDSSILDASYQSNFLPSKFRHRDNEAHTVTTEGTLQKEATTTPTPGNISMPILNAFPPPILSTTGGHSNTDHIIQCTGDERADKIAEYKRSLRRRAKDVQPEQRGQDRWDQPRAPGSRRRRIVREKDLPKAPPEPPHSGYVLFIAQMTTKVRHDNPTERHDQISVVKKISKMWMYALSESDRKYYNDFADEANEEYKKQHAEFRATGSYTPSQKFERLEGNGPWVRKAIHEKIGLEREISSYKTVKFPPRPDNIEKPHWVIKVEEQREREKKRRKLREEKKKIEEKEKLKALQELHRTT